MFLSLSGQTPADIIYSIIVWNSQASLKYA